MQTKALVVTEHGDREVLQVRDVDVPPPGAGQAQIEVAAVGVNFIDVYQRQGVYPLPTPFVLCQEGAGVVTAVGAGVDEVRVGDRVAWALEMGAGASLANIQADRLVPVPAPVDLETAAAAMLQGMTAHALCATDGAFQTGPGTTAVVHAAAGGVGQLLVQLITGRGGTVIATAGSDAKLEVARGRGAVAGVNYSEHDTPQTLSDAIRQANGGEGVHVVFDGVGRATFDASLASLRRRGTLVVFGGASGQVPPFDIQRLNQAGSVFLTRPNLVHYVVGRQELLRRGGEVFDLIASGRLDIAVGGRYALAEAARAYADLEGRASTGKLVLIP